LNFTATPWPHPGGMASEWQLCSHIYIISCLEKLYGIPENIAGYFNTLIIFNLIGKGPD
jgi:hypothetical protein